jgi:hypothetical protein
MKIGTNVILILILSIALVVLALAFVGFKKYGDLNNKVDVYTQMLADRLSENTRSHTGTNSVSHNDIDEPTQEESEMMQKVSDTYLTGMEVYDNAGYDTSVSGAPVSEMEEEEEDESMKQFLNTLKETVETETITEDVFLKHDLESIVEEEEEEDVEDVESVVEDIEDVEELVESDEEEEESDCDVLVLEDDEDIELELEDDVSEFEEEDEESDISIEFN